MHSNEARIGEIQAANSVTGVSTSSPVERIGRGAASFVERSEPEWQLASDQQRRAASPSVICGMTFLHRDKDAAARCANLSTGAQTSFNGRAIPYQIDHVRRKEYRCMRRRWAKQLDPVLGGNCTGRVVRAGAFHQVISRCPVAMAIKQCSNPAAVQTARERFIFPLRLPFGDYVVVLGKTANAQAFRIGWAASPADIVWGVFLLQ